MKYFISNISGKGNYFSRKAKNVNYYERLISSYYESPKIRYERFLKNAPEMFLRIPHHILANYLGMTKETLSRLRKPAG